MDELEMDLVEISSHAGQDLNASRIRGRFTVCTERLKGYPLLSDTSYGEIGRLFGEGCGTVPGYIPGTPKDYEPTIKKKRLKYTESQTEGYCET